MLYNRHSFWPHSEDSVGVVDPVPDDELAAHHSLEVVDIVPGDTETTAFKRRARLHQALWRERHNLDEGSQPIRPKPQQPWRHLGSRLSLAQAFETEANFLSERARDAVRYRLAHPEPNQILDKDRLYGDLLSSMPMCFNLFGPLFEDPGLATNAIKSWWPDVPGSVYAVRFEWSPGRMLQGEYLENRSAFDVAFEMALEDGSKGCIL
jgi:hypothetical protein